jgi:hypothetical protein
MKRCRSKGKSPNCYINGCGVSHYPLLHNAVKTTRIRVDDCINKGSASFETMGQVHATKPEKQAEQGATKVGWPQARKRKAKRVSDSTIKLRHPAGQRDGMEIAKEMHVTNDAKASCDDGISCLVQVTNATTSSKDCACGGTVSTTTPAHAPKKAESTKDERHLSLDKGRGCKSQQTSPAASTHGEAWEDQT